MGEIRIVGPGKTRGYPYPVCKNFLSRPAVLAVRKLTLSCHLFLFSTTQSYHKLNDSSHLPCKLHAEYDIGSK